MRETTEDELKSTVMNLLFQLPEKDREEILAPYFPKKSCRTLAKAIEAHEKEVMLPARPKGRLLVFSPRTKIK